ncbi:MAG TPA: hypothetical protein PKE40_14090 [Arachnia sp.]|nr:hypothetical protein [Arachnia sp.]HMT87473.1 hypothetical protein [Arachnia sp.]
MANQQWPEGQYMPEHGQAHQGWGAHDQRAPQAPQGEAWQPQPGWPPAQEGWQPPPQQPQGEWQQQQPEWPQQPQVEWQQQQPQPEWPQPGPYSGASVPSKPSPFDFGVKALSLPGSAGVIFTLGTIALGVEWLLGLVEISADVIAYGMPAFSVLSHLVGGLAVVLVKVLVLRVLIEIGVALATLLARGEGR